MSYCNQCGTPSSGGSAFCISCGSQLGSTETPLPPPPSVPSTAVVDDLDAVKSSAGPISGRRKRVLFGLLVLALMTGVGAGAFVAGKSSVPLKSEKKKSYDDGYTKGHSVGYDSGWDSGYSRGKTAGCYSVFSMGDGTWSHVIPYDPFAGYFGNRYPGKYYFSKSDC